MSQIGNLFVGVGILHFELNPVEITPLTPKSRFVPLGSFFVMCSLRWKIKIRIKIKIKKGTPSCEMRPRAAD